MENGPAITEENHVTSAAKLTRRQYEVLESLEDIGTSKPRTKRPSLLATSLREVKPYNFC
jgi:hypothetical protein